MAQSHARRSRAPVGYAVVGLGHIAQVAVLPAFRHASNSKLVALVSDDGRKRRLLGLKYRVSDVYDDAHYARCLRNPAVEAVYIAVPNHRHRAFAVAAARAGKHVLCEKPLAVTERDCEAMIRAAEENGVRLMTAYRLHFERANLMAAEMVRRKRIGDPRLFQAVFSMQVQKGNIRTGPTVLGGGPLYDIGVYCINAARSLFASEPTEVFAASVASPDERFRKSPEAMSSVLRFPGDRLAAFTCSFGAADAGWYQAVGTRGDLRANPAFEYAEPLTLRVTVDGKTRETRFGKRDQFAAELVYFSECVRRGRTPEPSGREGLADIRVIRALLKSARTGKAVSLSGFERRRRPGLALEIRRPPVNRPPDVILAAPPSAHSAS